MTRQTLFSLALVAAILAFPTAALSQAAAESALANSASGAAGAKTGGALGNALDKINRKLGDNLSNAVQQPQQPQSTPAPSSAPSPSEIQPVEVQPSRAIQIMDLPPNQSAPGAPIPGDSSLVLNIQGAGKTCPTDIPEDATAEKPAQPSTSSDKAFVICTSRAEPKPKKDTKYKPIVQVSF